MSAPAFEDIRRAPPLAEQVYDRLRRELRTGGFAPGQRLSDAVLAQAFAVSRAPVREALSRLAADGLLATGSGGFQVATPTAQDMLEIFDIRRMIEPPAAHRVAKGVTPALADALDAALVDARAAEQRGDFAAFAAANYVFRATWVGEVPSRRLRETILRFDDQAGLVRHATLVLPAARADALALLGRLARAFRAGDGPAVAVLTGQFIDAAQKFFEQTIELDRVR